MSQIESSILMHSFFHVGTRAKHVNYDELLDLDGPYLKCMHSTETSVIYNPNMSSTLFQRSQGLQKSGDILVNFANIHQNASWHLGLWVHAENYRENGREMNSQRSSRKPAGIWIGEHEMKKRQTLAMNSHGVDKELIPIGNDPHITTMLSYILKDELTLSDNELTSF